MKRRGMSPIQSIYAYENEANTSVDGYKYFNANSEAFEWMCIQCCLYLDSHILMYEDVQLLADTYKYVGMTLCSFFRYTNFIALHV